MMISDLGIFTLFQIQFLHDLYSATLIWNNCQWQLLFANAPATQFVYQCRFYVKERVFIWYEFDEKLKKW